METSADKIIAEKVGQVPSLLEAADLDCWLVYGRETRMMADPVMALLVGEDVTWESFFAFHRDGRSIALVGNFDRDLFSRKGLYTEVRTYTKGADESVKDLLTDLDPSRIGVNFSLDDPAADGLPHGLFLRLQSYLDGTEFASRILSAETVCRTLRARKTETEVSLLSRAAHIADGIWATAVPKVEVGMTERQIGALIDGLIAERGLTNSFDTIVNAGDKTDPGHGAPTDAVLGVGDLLHVDFGVECEGYCSDIQRLLYMKKPGEIAAPTELVDAFQTVRGIIEQTAGEARPGRKGWEIDDLARRTLRDNGYPEYEHALGHQLGQSVHDGGALLGPRWERYGESPLIPLENNNVFTLELEIRLPGIGCVGLEEDVRITDQGAEFIGPRQTELLTS